MAVWPILACNFGAPFAITPKVYSDCDHAKRATLHLERHPGTSPHSLAQPVLALAHRDLHRRQDDTYRLSRVLGIPLAGASPTLALPEVDGRNGSLRSPKNEAGIVERVLRLTLKKPCLLHLFVLLSMVSGFAFSSLLQAQSSTHSTLPDAPSTAQQKSPQPNSSQTGAHFDVLPTPSISFPELAASHKVLTPWNKFELFMQDSISPSAVMFSLASAGFSQARDSYSGYGQGAEGYAKRFGAKRPSWSR